MYTGRYPPTLLSTLTTPKAAKYASVDQFCLAPYYLFRDRYIITDDKGATIGYKNLNEIKEKLKGVLIRRTKRQVRLQMPARQDKNLLVPMTEEQMTIHNEAKNLTLQRQVVIAAREKVTDGES